MTFFDEREKAFETRYSRDQDLEFKILVRRGGPNYQAGLAAMRALADGGPDGLDVEVNGPDKSMTCVCARAIEWVRSFD